MLSLNSIMIGSKQAQALVDFYEKVFGKPADMNDPENGFWGWQVGRWIRGDLELFRNGRKDQRRGATDNQF